MFRVLGMTSGGSKSPLRRVIACCTVQVKEYGQCVAAKAPAVDKGMCEKEFLALRACMKSVIGAYGSAAMSHAYVQYPPFRCDIPGALGVTYDDANKLLIVPTVGEMYAWSISSYPTRSDPLITQICQGPVLGVRFSLDCKVVTVLRSNTEIEFVNREDCTSFRENCISLTDRILGFFWTDCPDCDLVLITTSGLELYSIYLGKGKLKLVDRKRQSVSWFVYTHESRLVLLASGAQCKTLSGYQFSAGGVVRLPKFDAVLSKSETHRSPVLGSDNVFIATMYGRLYCLQVDPIAKLIRMYRFYRDAVISQNFLPTYASNVSVSVVDNVLLVHQIDSKVVLLYDILSDSKVPISAPLPLLVRHQGSHHQSQRKLAAEEASLYSEGWVFSNPDVILDHTRGLLWKIQLDLEAIAASSSDISFLLGFLQRRRHESAKAKQLSLSILRSIIMEKRSLSLISSALAVVSSATGHAKRAASPKRASGSISSMPLILTPGMQPAAFATALALGNAEFSNGTYARQQLNDDEDYELTTEGSSGKSSNSENQAYATPTILAEEMCENVFAAIDEGMTVDASFLVAVMLEYLRSATTEQLVLPAEFHVLLARLLARDKSYVKLHQLVVNKVLEPSKPLALQLLEIGEVFFELGIEMLRHVRAHKDYVHLLLRRGRLLEGLRYIRQNKVESATCMLFLEAAAQEDQSFQLLATVLRFCCDFVPNFDQTADFVKFYSVLKRKYNDHLS